ncbi:ribonuclease P protein component [uncultured Microbacterium sp.]|uniref:ribonuclease P protein component n=1 Tax=uncultured Microbacterium sp. TaxID=191216 RepID=UPI001E14BD30|nr:ribonuclease P protein component [uncultured Microbacterium sp.]MBS1898794.1 ribonuclease P protein component [Actinomycetota bacterium]
MLARPHRLVRGSDYRTVVRRGRRYGGPRLIVSVLDTGEERPARFGFIVSKQVGNAVTRNTVRRRLKDACARQLPLRDGIDVVIRALPTAARATFAELLADVDGAVARGAR